MPAFDQEKIATAIELEYLIMEWGADLDSHGGRNLTRLLTEDCNYLVGGKSYRGHAEVQAYYDSRVDVIRTQFENGRTQRHAISNLRYSFHGGGKANVSFMLVNFSRAGEAASEAEVDKLHAKIGRLLVERDLYVGSFVKRRAQNLWQTLSGCLFHSVEIGGVDRPCAGVRLAHQLISDSSMTACHKPTCTAQTFKGTVSHFLPVHSPQSYSRSPSPRFQALAGT